MFNLVFKCEVGTIQEAVSASNDDVDNTDNESMRPTQNNSYQPLIILNTYSDTNQPSSLNNSNNITESVCNGNRKYKKIEKLWEISYYNLLIVNINVFADCQTATEVFVEIFNGTFENIVYHTMRSTQKNKNVCLTVNELYKFIGMIMIMGYHVLPSCSNWTTGVTLQLCTIL